ncbi:nicotinic acid mononucleotide adenylyltransferase [Aphanothece hegewaldii CCALA 016]|uniref:nicotinate-nucleotide adenylyltransferase n=1 Tax=Aphanothece hegewaldii CCALA 016 TaxID=2107694 RepID=A0A2T1M373_9CHRO|nr:nicotinate-nucleotide adenylyltransferase [Aphanothece hegewaldii]PSF39282.1 nicotinic acid mononucleotide adenylyltransferase [Aphanothece hegewaldii CCALA 016]
MLKIALFGTSADPPTAGHQAILKWLSYHFDWVAVWASDNPFKTHQTSLEHRMEMLNLLIQEINNSKNNIELRKDLSHRRSLVSVDKARKIWGNDAEYYLVIGSDLIQQIRRWYQSEELLQKAKIVIVPRRGYPIYTEDITALEKIGGSCQIADLNAPEASSTAYREQHDYTVVTQPIREYIHKEKLYA